MAAATAALNEPGWMIMDATDWMVIPAENLVAAAQVWLLLGLGFCGLKVICSYVSQRVQ